MNALPSLFELTNLFFYSPLSGPLELCARQKMLVRRETKTLSEKEFQDLSQSSGTMISLQPKAEPILTSNPSSSSNLNGARTRTGPTSVPTRSRPIGLSSRKEGSETTIEEGVETSNLIGAQPRSLPEPDCSPWHQNLNPTHNHNHIQSHSRVMSEDYYSRYANSSNHSKKTAPGLPRRPSLGIEVLEEIDRAAKKARRPTLAKTLTTFGKSKTEIPRPSSTNKRSVSETLLDQVSLNSGEPEDALNTGSSSGVLNSSNGIPSIEATLASSTPTHDEETGNASLMNSIASLPSTSSTVQPESGEGNGIRGRGRGFSVASYASFGTFGAGRSSSVDDLSRSQRSEAEGKEIPIKVIVEVSSRMQMSF